MMMESLEVGKTSKKGQTFHKAWSRRMELENSHLPSGSRNIEQTHWPFPKPTSRVKEQKKKKLLLSTVSLRFSYSSRRQAGSMQLSRLPGQGACPEK